MAGQGLFFKGAKILGGCRLLLNNKLLQLCPQPSNSGLKQEVKRKLKELNVPEKPKRPLTAYLRFSQDRRSSIIKEHPQWKIIDISKQCAADWRTLDSTLKQHYQEQYKKDLKDYERNCSTYLNNLTHDQKEALENYRDEVKKSKKKRELKKKFKELNKPKRPIGAYMLFVMEQAKIQEKSYSELLSLLKEEWSKMSDEKKLGYTQEAAKAKERYDHELKLWEMKMIEEGHEDVVRDTTLTSKQLSRQKNLQKTSSE